MKTKLFIPKKLKVGFQERQGTFTGKLAYVTYFDEKGVLRKETSWQGWRDKKIEPIEIDNAPLNGFMLNKGIQRYADWGSGRSVIRVHHPDGFEFEISVDNLIGLLMHSDVSKRDIQEACVFAWAGTELVLLPVNSDAYQESVAYTEKQDRKVSAKELVKGRQYHQKKSDGVLTYIGYFDWYVLDWTREESERRGYGWNYHYNYTTHYTQLNKGKKHVFFDGTNFVVPSVSTLSCEVSQDIVADYAELVDKFYATTHSQPITGVQFEPLPAGPMEVEAWSMELARLSNNGSRLEKVSFRTDCFRHRHHLSGGCISLEGGGYSMVFDPKYVLSHHSSDSVKDTIRVNYNGEYPDGLTEADFQPLNERHYGALLSERFIDMLRARGWGSVRYILKNGTISSAKP